jgi:hypothetical protein
MLVLEKVSIERKENLSKQIMSQSKNIAGERLNTHNATMKTKIGVAVVALAIMFIANASVSVAWADPQLPLIPLTLTIGDGQLPTDFSDSSDVNQLVPSAAVSFSPSPVPEPATIGFLTVGTVLLAVAKKRIPKLR